VLGREYDPGPDARMRGIARTKVECKVGAKEENVLEMLDAVREDFGGVVKYVREKCGLEEWDVDAVRRAITVDVAPCHYTRDSGCWE